jgi:hypothetical protein
MIPLSFTIANDWGGPLIHGLVGTVIAGLVAVHIGGAHFITLCARTASSCA